MTLRRLPPPSYPPAVCCRHCGDQSTAGPTIARAGTFTVWQCGRCHVPIDRAGRPL